jgi:hypothetical protein
MGKGEAPAVSDASVHSWLEWKKMCAADLCGEVARHELQQFAAVRFQKHANTEAYRTNDPKGNMLRVKPGEAWHLLEVYFTVHGTREGKRYKDWLFARVHNSPDDPIDIIQGGATNLMREVVREFIRRECPRWGIVSIQQPRTTTGDSGTVEDLLPDQHDPLTDVEAREYENLAAQHALALSSAIGKREKVALAAKELGRSLADPIVLKHAGCGKSVLSACYGDLIRKVVGLIQEAHPGEDAASLLYLAERTLAHLKDHVLHETPENPGLRTFLSVDGSPEP